MKSRSHRRRLDTNIYMVSISCQQKKEFISVETLKQVINWLLDNGIKLEDEVYENHGRYHQLHLHALCRVPLNFYYKPYTQYGDIKISLTFRIQWKRVYDLAGARNYLSKQIHNCYVQDQIIAENYYRYHYVHSDI